jgi:hypothetical protein
MKVKNLRKLSQHRIKMSNAQVREVDAAFEVFIHLFEKHAFLGAYAKLLKATVTFMSVRLSVCPPSWNNSTPIGRILIKFDI